MLQVHSLSVRRGSRVIFRDMTFTLNAGETLLIKGMNGSGKSSLLRAIAGLLPAKGRLEWHGLNLQDARDDTPHFLHYIGHRDALKPELTGIEMLDYWAGLFGRSPLEVVDMFGISAFQDRATRFLSTGQKRRVALNRLALYNAPLWLLDEPTNGLDPQMQAILLQHIEQHNAAGGIAVIATHHDMNLPKAQTLIMEPIT